jgi:hypothetical protein
MRGIQVDAELRRLAGRLQSVEVVGECVGQPGQPHRRPGGLRAQRHGTSIARLARGRAILTVLVGVLGAGCTGEDGRPAPTSPSAVPRLTAERMTELRLTRVIPDQVPMACEEARRLVTARVICPVLIPNIPITTTKGSYGSVTFPDQPRVYMLSFDKDFFHKPTNCGEASARGNCPGVKHWIVGAGDADVVRGWILTDRMNEVAGDAELVRSMTVDGRSVLVYRYPEYPAGGVNGSHMAAFVPVGDQLVFASLHGARWVKAAIEMALDLARQVVAGPS